MVRHNEGLARTYNRFHDRDRDATEPDPAKVAAIQRLRELHAAVDRAVLDAYGWTDVPTDCQFILDYEEEESGDRDQGSGKKKRGKKKPWRYRWPDEVRDDVLARLLELNIQRAEAERLTGAGAAEKKKGRKAAVKKAPARRKGSGTDAGRLFSD